MASVDREMSAIRDAGKVKARERIAVLAALNLAYQLADRPPRASTPHPEAPMVVYGEAYHLGEARLALTRVAFKHIPYDVKAR